MRTPFVVLILVAACGSVDGAAVPDAGELGPPPDAERTIGQALSCGTPASAGGLAPGTDLLRVDLDLAVFPEARCNDGTAGIFFFRPAASVAGEARWVIQLQGGGGCGTPETCAQRWCSVGTNFGMTQMSSTLAPAGGTRADGILSRNPLHANPLADANHVFIRYCSSDNWSGRSGPVQVQTTDPATGMAVQFKIGFQGQAILDAVIATIRYDGAAPPPYMVGDVAVALPDLDDAEEVVLAGASAGGGGVVNNADRIGDELRVHNPGLADYTAIIDSTFSPDRELLDWTTSTMCAAAGVCTWEDILAAGNTLYDSHGDASCDTWHAANDPARAYLCNDTDHSVRNHLVTPMLVRMGLTDQLIGGNTVASGVTVPGLGPMTLPLFAELVHDELAALAQLLVTAEEAAAIPVTPATYGPACPDHETLSTNVGVYGVTVEDAGVPYRMFDVFTAWKTGAAPTSALWEPGEPIDCVAP
jgi:hypothetical protein